MKNPSLVVLKIFLSVPIAFGLADPFLYPEAAGGILDEFKIFGPIGTAIAIAVFLMLVFFYARDLMKTLQLVSPESRKAPPKSVWLMFLLPYNFIEDFFIVANVANSLKAEAVVNSSLAHFKSFGMVSGIGWCMAQVISLIPNQIGAAAGVLAMILWIWHWIFIRRANRALGRHA